MSVREAQYGSVGEQFEQFISSRRSIGQPVFYALKLSDEKKLGMVRLLYSAGNGANSGMQKGYMTKYGQGFAVNFRESVMNKNG